MRRNGSLRLPVLVALGGLVLAGCSSGDGDVRAVGPVPTAAPTTVVETTTTTLPVTTTTTAGRPTTTRPAPTTAPPATRPTPTTAPPTTVGPVVVDGIPQVTATPSTAAVGTRVRIEGTGFTEEIWKPRDTRLWLRAPSGCGLSADADHTVTVSSSGRLTGEFVVPSTGNCPQSSVGDVPLTSGTYRIVFMCSPCTIGQLEVT